VIFYLVCDASTVLHVAVYHQDRVYSFDHHTARFHINRGLWMDYFVDGELRWDVVTPAQARQHIANRAGWYEPAELPDLHAEHQRDLRALDPWAYIFTGGAPGPAGG
jgi:hypothetical protein